MRLRRAHRGGFDPLPLAPELLGVLQECAARYGAVLRVITDEGTRAALAEVVQAAERALELDSAHARERAAWTAAPGSSRADGVSATAYPARAERTFPHFPGPDFARGRGWGRPPLSMVPGRSAGVVCLLATSADQPADWVSAGQALQRILLNSAAWGVAAALHSQPFELGWGRGLIAPPARGRLCPQLLLRLGIDRPDRGRRAPPAGQRPLHGRRRARRPGHRRGGKPAGCRHAGAAARYYPREPGISIDQAGPAAVRPGGSSSGCHGTAGAAASAEVPSRAAATLVSNVLMVAVATVCSTSRSSPAPRAPRGGR